MGWFNIRWGTREICITPYKSDMDIFKIVKLKTTNMCSCCEKKLNIGTHVFGTQWVRLCINCGQKFNDKAIKEFKDIVKMIKKVKKEVIKNKDKYDAENIVASL